MCKFKKHMAVSYGINAAIIAQFIWDNLHYGDYYSCIYLYDEKTWCRCSVLMITAFYPFLSRSAVSKAFKILIDENVLIKGCFNGSKFDKTNWYTFTEYGVYKMLENEGMCDE